MQTMWMLILEVKGQTPRKSISKRMRLRPTSKTTVKTDLSYRMGAPVAEGSKKM